MMRFTKSFCSKVLPKYTSMIQSTAAFSTVTGDVSVELGDVFKAHAFPSPPSTATTNREELMEYLRLMYTMRRMEITCDTEYKARAIRGFCHLYDGQEAVAMGIQSALSKEDAWITSYRCHCVAFLRGKTVEQVLAELYGFSNGATKGKGGSMHFYSKQNGFFGGQGIVGAQVPVGAGLAFAQKYLTPEGQKTPIAIACYGDGAANQGQIWEAANMSALWKLPMVFVIENNHYGMGTSTQRSSSNDSYYTMGNKIPGLRVNGMNVLAVREGVKAVREYVSSGNGPMFLEFDTYRYHGHSMSDPGTTYRTREEVGDVRTARDPIEYVKKILVDKGLSTADEVKAVEKNVRDFVNQSMITAKAGQPPPVSELTTEVYSDNDGKDAPADFVRLPDIKKSVRRNF